MKQANISCNLDNYSKTLYCTMTGCSVLMLCCTIGLLMPMFTTSRDHKRSKVDFKLDLGKLVIDSDAGGDDAVAILLALGQPGVDVIAVTCVNGNTGVDNVVKNVLKTLDTVNRLDIPVYRGATKSIHLTPESDNFFGMDGFGDFEYPNPPDPNEYLKPEHAVNALITLVTNNPGEVTVLCLGPLTNIALAIRLDPLFLSKVKQIVVLGGGVEGDGNIRPGVEFNFYVDPQATFIVFNSIDTTNENIRPVYLFPLESFINRNSITLDWRLNVLGALPSPQVQLLNKAELAILQGTYWQCGDAFASAVTINASLVTEARSQYLEVVTQGGSAGAVLVDYQNTLNRSHNVIIVQNIDVDGLKALMLRNLA